MRTDINPVVLRSLGLQHRLHDLSPSTVVIEAECLGVAPYGVETHDDRLRQAVYDLDYADFVFRRCRAAVSAFWQRDADAFFEATSERLSSFPLWISNRRISLLRDVRRARAELHRKRAALADLMHADMQVAA